MKQFYFLRKIRSKKKLEYTINGKLDKACMSLDRDVINAWEDILPTLAKSSYEGSIEHKIEVLEQLITHYYNYKKFCYLRRNYRIYFQSVWEHCHNTHNPDFEYIEPHYERYQYLMDHREQLLAKEKFREENLRRLDERLLYIIADNPGILQKDIYSYFDSIVKNDIGITLLNWSKDGRIVRYKSGNTYKLYLPDYV